MPGPVLVANRGEVAVRIVRACRERGLRSIVVHTDVDAGSLAVRVADAAVRVDSYLDVDAVVAAAQGVWAVHPGYGLLAEDAGFARAVADAGLVFVGPPADVVAAMGDKVRARALARRCGVPVLDGTDGPVSPGHAREAAAEIGFPLLVKAAHGGGGRGMRVVAAPGDLDDAVVAAAREAAAAFGRGEVFLERHVARARHVEVQVLADHHGAVAVLGDRDCTVQRRHQKLLEEAPAPDLPVRTELHEAARRLAAAVGYRGAGTVEFLLDRDTGAPAFLEMNTRLQVEHGVTEMVTGVDLVVAQLRLAAGEHLSAVAERIDARGHAVQARIAAEDPGAGFRPTPGRVTALTLPAGPWVRADLGVEAGDDVPGAYDSLVGKVLAWGPDRATAVTRLAGALDDLVVTGVSTTGPYLRTVLDRPEYLAASHDTGSVERDWAPTPERAPLTTAGVRTVRLATDRGPLDLRVPRHRGEATVEAAAAPATVGTPAAATTGDPVAPMDATVVDVAVEAGDDIAAGAVLVVLEAMKMELPVRAPHAARVDAVRVAPGDRVTAGSALVVLGAEREG